MVFYENQIFLFKFTDVICVQDKMTTFHSDKFLVSIRPDNMGEYSKLLQRLNVVEDCPVFEGQ